ncbi:MAG: DUF4388 domain-containing protein [Actinobacteria bacterium]|nr:DUF4388 domain-containing protein [Actinomycetota bacterium]
MLEGTLESFTLPDIFQLLAFTKKTGCLHLQRDSATGEVYFRDGQVYFAVSTTGRMALGKRLVGAGMVATDQLERALEKQQDDASRGRALRLGQILVKEGVLDAETLETFVREQVQDAVFDLMRWSNGSFQFDTEGEDAVIDEPTELAASVENLIMEGSRRLEEWHAVRKKIPSMDATVAIAPSPTEAGVEVSLKPEEWRLLTLVDGRRTVHDLVELAGQGQFATCKLLYGMVGAGMLEVRDVETEGPSSVAAMLQQQDLLRRVESGEPIDRAVAPPRGTTATVVGTESPDVDEEPETSEEPEVADVSDEVEEAPATGPEAADDSDVQVDEQPTVATADERPVTPQPLTAKPSAVRSNGGGSEESERLGTDPTIDADLVRRLIEGVRGL